MDLGGGIVQIGIAGWRSFRGGLTFVFVLRGSLVGLLVPPGDQTKSGELAKVAPPLKVAGGRILQELREFPTTI